MVTNLGFSQLPLITLVLIGLMIHVWWSNNPRTTPHRALTPDQPRRKRSTEPNPFPGFLHNPLCAAWEQGAAARPQAPGAPPPLLRCTRGRRRTVNPHAPFGPEPPCASYGRLGRGNSRANGPPGGQPWRP
jgi:hypothetical protein